MCLFFFLTYHLKVNLFHVSNENLIKPKPSSSFYQPEKSVFLPLNLQVILITSLTKDAEILAAGYTVVKI